MAFTTSPNMGLTVPGSGTEYSPNWATDLNASLSVIDGHNHAPGSGVQITPTGININTDLPFNNTNNAISLRSIRFFPQGSPLSGAADLGCLFESGVDLYYRDGAGNAVRITQSGSVAGSTGTITGLPSGTASAAFSAASGTFIFQQATSTAANLDVASIAIRYPGSYPTASGNYIQLQAPSALATGYAFTLPATLPAGSGAFLTSSTSGVISYTNVDNSTLTISANTIAVKSGGITGTQVASNINLPGKSVQENGNNIVVSNANATNSLSVLRGSIAASGTISQGEGFTITHTTAGTYLITFTTAFNDAPSVIATSAQNPNTSAVLLGAISSTSSATVYTTNVSGTLTNFPFFFIIMGQRS